MDNIRAHGDAVQRKWQLNVDSLKLDHETAEMLFDYLERTRPIAVQFTRPSADDMQRDFSLLEQKLEWGGFTSQQDEGFVDQVRELSVMADLATTKVSHRSHEARVDLANLEIKVKAWFFRIVYTSLSPGARDGHTFMQRLNEGLPSFVQQQQQTLNKVTIDEEYVWGLLWFLTSKCEVNWHKHGRPKPPSSTLRQT